jgi:hypothetical protein
LLDTSRLFFLDFGNQSKNWDQFRISGQGGRKQCLGGCTTAQGRDTTSNPPVDRIDWQLTRFFSTSGRISAKIIGLEMNFNSDGGANEIKTDCHLY